MSPMIDFASYQFMNLAQTYRFIIKNGIFITCQNQVKSVGFIIYEKDYSTLKLKNILKDAATQLTTELKNLQIKIIGPEQLISKWKNLFSAEWNVKIIYKEGELEYIYDPHENRTRVAAVKNTSTATETFEHSKTKTIDTKQKPTKTSHVLQGQANTQPNPIKLLIVDDSKTIRLILRGIFTKCPQIKIVADTGDPLEVISLIEKHQPHVITLDIHMPDKDGVTLLKEYIGKYRIPTVMISSISMEEGPHVLNALETGAVDYIQKPEQSEISEVSDLMIEKIKAASTAKVKGSSAKTQTIKRRPSSAFTTNSLIAIGSSTGGTEALKQLFEGLPDQIPPIVVVQHIPPVFSKAFADRLNSLFKFEVKEAENGDLVLPNRVLIAPGGKQMKVIQYSGKLQILIEDSEPVNRHKPSVDVLFDSLLECKIKESTAVILTGMGGDGAKAMLRLREKGWNTIAQDKESCVVFGMPAVAIQLGGVQHICPLQDIANKLQELNSLSSVA